ncbi:MAG: hypothetical protein A2Y07_03695 [Planctomycetes bacterium GWF2_50_10]|nr:MAG: hypothetical protein A2Y07_03695 [Planctomycetes bacterium GWF2_50_10]
MKSNLEEIARIDGRYTPLAMAFVYEGLGHTVKKNAEEAQQGGPQHVTGRDLSEGLKELALQKYGRLAKTVLNHWGIQTTRDFGEIVYLMIANQWMSAQPSDSIDDFNDIFDFSTVFEKNFTF